MNKVQLPELGEGINKAIVACWHAKVGDSVSVGDDLVELVTDKAVFSVEAPVTGVLKQAFFKKGEEADIGATLATIESE